MEYSKDIKSVLSNTETMTDSLLGDPRAVIKVKLLLFLHMIMIAAKYFYISLIMFLRRGSTDHLVVSYAFSFRFFIIVCVLPSSLRKQKIRHV